MCGIIGYIGKKDDAIKVAIDGLKRLEYRGYDSCGLCYLDKDEFVTVKAVGAISSLENKLGEKKKSSMCIGHTRWATHGGANEVNSHPHSMGEFGIVHNGIIENYMEIKEELQKNGYIFKSETDTEVAVALIDYLYKKEKDVLKVLESFKKKANGSYAIVIIHEGDYDRLFAIKNMSPLIVGIGENENYLASDVPAILDRTNRYATLNDGEIVIVSKDEVQLFDNEGRRKVLEVKTFMGDSTSIDKGEYEHFMLKEIHEEPDIVRRLLSIYLAEDKLSTLPDLEKFRNVAIVACGSAMHAGLVGKYMIEDMLGRPVSVEVASEFRYKKLFLNSDDVVIAISQSGETADTLAAVKIAKELGAHTIGIVNVKESSIAREVDEVVYTLAGSEIAVATTKAYLAQLVVLYLIALSKRQVDIASIMKLPIVLEELLDQAIVYDRIAEDIKGEDDIFFIGRQRDYAICMEGSLKLKEISYVHSEAYAAGELKHGTISLISEGTPVFAVITDASIAPKTISNIKEVKSRGAKVILLVSSSIDTDGDFYDEKIVISKVGGYGETVASVIPLQLIAYFVAKKRGCSIDKPRNLAKSVTVE
ncbi:MAG TPA: glutamine--fructose-6-phosphate transaminase (isomerizing) [Firmicutes bacterium]|nr:glutamine--fructose-6-phosphate transaminase (isomerizing) [Bacillota bacterium]